MSEQFVKHLLTSVAGIIFLAVVLKLNYQNFMNKNFAKGRLQTSKSIRNDFVSDIEDQVESLKRLNNCCNYIIAIGAIIFIGMYFSYVFNLFDAVPVNVMNY